MQESRVLHLRMAVEVSAILRDRASPRGPSRGRNGRKKEGE